MSYKFFQNKKCPYFPCHKVEKIEDFNCLFCYCPLYALKEKCGGAFKYTSKGIKDCSSCTVTHIKDEGYQHVQEKIKEILNMTKKKN